MSSSRYTAVVKFVQTNEEKRDQYGKVISPKIVQDLGNFVVRSNDLEELKKMLSVHISIVLPLEMG